MNFFKKNKKDFRILMTGLDDSGKTVIYYQFKMANSGNIEQKTGSTIGYNIDKIKYKDCYFQFIDFGGSDKIRCLAKHLYSSIDAFIYVVDSNDRERIKKTAEILKEMMNDEKTQKKPLLLMANKQDLDTCLSPEEVSKIMEIEKFSGREYIVIGTSHTSGKGLTESLDWLYAVLTNNKDYLKNKEIKKLKEELNISKNIIEELKKNEINNKNILYLEKLIKEKDEELNKSKAHELKNNQLNLSLVQNLQNMINEKNEELDKLKEKLKNNKCVNFLSKEEDLYFAIPCSGETVFSEIEELLYKEYPQYRGINNKFLINGKEIIPNKTINENKIETGKTIIFISSS